MKVHGLKQLLLSTCYDKLNKLSETNELIILPNLNIHNLAATCSMTIKGRLSSVLEVDPEIIYNYCLQIIWQLFAVQFI